MSRNSFRVILLIYFAFICVGGAFDYFWADPIAEKVSDYASEIEPELEGTLLNVIGVFSIVLFVLWVVSFIGLLFYWQLSRLLFLASSLMSLAIYPFLGITVSSGLGIVFYELSVMCSGAILALIYYSPVTEFYQRKI